MEISQEYQKSTYICFIEYKKAFDCANHDKLWRALENLGAANTSGQFNAVSIYTLGARCVNIAQKHWLDEIYISFPIRNIEIKKHCYSSKCQN